MSNYRKIAD
jgi:hypothetical protein